MSRGASWERPEVRKIFNQVDREEIAKMLAANDLNHLKVLSRGNHLVIYSEDSGEKVSRVRFTRVGNDEYQLGIADHTGRWDTPPLFGTLAELFDMTLEQFGWLLTDH